MNSDLTRSDSVHNLMRSGQRGGAAGAAVCECAAGPALNAETFNNLFQYKTTDYEYW